MRAPLDKRKAGPAVTAESFAGPGLLFQINWLEAINKKRRRW